MAPSRRKGAGKAAAAAAARRKWKVGDLVLAKVKGFPAWPAMVSEPEKWGYSADWKKVLVYFFGTQQIAFCNPADVEAFTEEKKQLLLTKRHGKGSDFVRAVKEIIESYEKVKNQEQAGDCKSVNQMNLKSGENSPLQVRENPPGASLDTQSKSDSSKGKDESTLLSEDASIAEQMLALRDNNIACEQPGDSVTVKETLKITTYSSKKKLGGVRSKKSVLPKKASSLQQSKSSSRAELHRHQRSMLQHSDDGGRGVDDMDDGPLIRRKRIRRSSGASESDDVGSLALNSNGSDEENASEMATVESDGIVRNEGNGVDSSSKLEHSDTIGECLEGDPELNKGLDFQIKVVVVKKKRKPTRKRGTNDASELPSRVDVETDLETGVYNTCQNSQNSHENLSERPSKENGDEHLPLVKRARVRMSRTFYTDDDVNNSPPFEERCSKEAAILSAKTSSPSNHDSDALSNCELFATEESPIVPPEVSTKISGDTADAVLSAGKRSSDNMSPLKSCIQILRDKPEDLKDRKNQISNSPNDEAAMPQSKQFSSSPDGEAALPSSGHLYCHMEVMSASAAEEVHACSGASSTMNTLTNKSDLRAVGCSNETIKTENHLEPDSVDFFANNASGLDSTLDTAISEEPIKSSAHDESQKHSSCEDTLVKSGDHLNEKYDNNDDCIVQNMVLSQTTEHSPADPSSPSTMNKSEAENFELREGPASPCKELDTSKSTQMSQNLVLFTVEVDVLPQDGEPQCKSGHSNGGDTEYLKLQDDKNSQLNHVCEVVEEVKKEHGLTVDSGSVSDYHSCEKMSVSPDLADSPARGTPHSNSICHISTAESANVVQNIGCSPIVRFQEKNILGGVAVEEGEKTATAVPQRSKFVGLTSNYAEAHSALQSFESMLGSLVRTKESIGRATRLAMDCAKFGVSAKVMEILAHNLECESNLQRRVDLFFLVDSVAQCSRGLKGDAGDVYLSVIKAMLPRLLFAAAPPGATTPENRRQCLKVLRLWLERRILPESVICHHIRELDLHNSSLSACLYSRRSARTERALDDPVRDMEGMLVDEYGSNSTLQLTGFCMPSMLKDEDGESDSDGGNFEAVTPEHESGVPEELQVTTSAAERHTHILEDVDGELEMEDVAPSCEVGVSSYNNVAQNDTSHNHFGQQLPLIACPQPHDVPSSSPPLPPSPPPPPPPPPSHPSQCTVLDSYSNGFDCGGYSSMHGDNPNGAPRTKPPMPTNGMHYQGPESNSSYGSCGHPTNDMPHADGSNFQHRPYPPCPPPHPPPPPNQFPYMQPGHNMKSRRDAPPYSHRSHYMPNYDDRNFHDNHERMRPGPYESRENWGYPPPSSYGPRYHDKPRGPYPPGSYDGPPREPARFQNQRWNHPPRPFNHRNSFHYKPNSEGPVPVGMRDPGMWHQR